MDLTILVLLHIFLIGQFPRVSLLFGYPKLVVKQAKSPTSSVTTYNKELKTGKADYTFVVVFLKAAAAAAVTQHHQ